MHKFVNYILDGQPEPPFYFARMKFENRVGPDILGSLPEPQELSLDKIDNAAKDDKVIFVDTRDWDSYKESHLPGAIFAQPEHDFPSITGSFIRKEQKIVLVISPEMVRQTVTDLIRIGLDDVVAFISPDTMEKYIKSGGKVSSIKEIHIKDFENIRSNPDIFLLDVRKGSELVETGYIPGANNIAHTRLLLSDKLLPKDKEIYVHCMGGGRSTSSASYLQGKGYSVTHLKGGFQEWKNSNGEIARVS